MQDDLEARLKTLLPIAAGIDPIAAAYAAGKQNAARANRQWRVCAAALALIAMVSWMLPAQKPAIVSPPEIAIASAPAPAIDEIEPAPPGNMWQLRAAVLEKGLDGLPNTPLPPMRAERGSETS